MRIQYAFQVIKKEQLYSIEKLALFKLVKLLTAYLVFKFAISGFIPSHPIRLRFARGIVYSLASDHRPDCRRYLENSAVELGRLPAPLPVFHAKVGEFHEFFSY